MFASVEGKEQKRGEISKRVQASAVHYLLAIRVMQQSGMHICELVYMHWNVFFVFLFHCDTPTHAPAHTFAPPTQNRPAAVTLLQKLPLPGG